MMLRFCTYCRRMYTRMSPISIYLGYPSIVGWFLRVIWAENLGVCEAARGTFRYSLTFIPQVHIYSSIQISKYTTSAVSPENAW
jgi:hypothetical protein